MLGPRIINMQDVLSADRNMIQYCTIPISILLGGYLADNVLEPFMCSGSASSSFLYVLVGKGDGTGIAVMFLCTGTLGFLVCVCALCSRQIMALNTPGGESE